MMPRRSKPPSDAGWAQEEAEKARKAREEFSTKLRRRVLEELAVPEDQAATWLSARAGVRWQTAQFWLRGDAMPAGRNLARVAEVVAMNPSELFQVAIQDEPDTPVWLAFLETPEGKSLSTQERHILQLLPWQKDPTVADYRSLLAIVRQNAER
jgi:hypothetical protein